MNGEMNYGTLGELAERCSDLSRAMGILCKDCSRLGVSVCGPFMAAASCLAAAQQELDRRTGEAFRKQAPKAG